MGDLSVREAAEQLGVAERRVRAMIHAGQLPARKLGHVWAIDAAAIKRAGGRRTGRPLSAANAWALLALLSGVSVDWVDSAVRSRLRGRASDPDWLLKVVEHSEPRSIVHRLRVLEGDLERISERFQPVPTGLSVQLRQLDVVSPARGINGYLDSRQVKELMRRFRPILESSAPNLVLRIPAHPWILSYREAPPAVVAADLLQDDDPRVSRAARNLLRILASDPHP